MCVLLYYATTQHQWNLRETLTENKGLVIIVTHFLRITFLIDKGFISYTFKN